MVGGRSKGIMRHPFLSGVVAVAAALVLLVVPAGPGQAQYRGVRVMPAFGQASWVTPYVRLNQQAYANTVLGQSLYNVPPWAFGYNPYPRVVNYYVAPYPYYPPGYYYGPYPYYGGYYSAPYTPSYVTPYFYGPGFP
jgi:hypothetical protein